MLIVFPFSKNDLHLAVPLMAWIRKLGPYPRHDLLLAYSQELTALERETVAMSARECGWRTPPHAFDAKITAQKWPDAPNEIFRQTASLIQGTPSLHRPWLFLEPDCTPIRRGWADALADAFNADLTLPFMGVVDTTYAIMEGTGELVKTGEHLCGCAIYPPNLRDYTAACLTCQVAFDHAMARDIRPHARNSPLFQDNWSTGNYRREGERIVCNAVTLRIALSGRPTARPVQHDAMLVHGCKDGSLLALLRAELDAAANAAKTVEIAPYPSENSGQDVVFTSKAGKSPKVIKPRLKPKRYKARRRVDHAWKVFQGIVK